MASETTGNVRTLIGYAADLLQYPRLIIERDVDFTNCRRGGKHNAFMTECVECRFGAGCRWLDQHRTPNLNDARLDELTKAIEGACDYLQAKVREEGADDGETLTWIREARRFLRARRT